MAINLADSERKEGVWYEYDEDVKLKIRHVSVAWIEKTRKQFVSRKTIRGRTEEFMSKEKEQQFNDALYDHLLEDWEGVTLDGEAPAPCTTDNKRKLLDGFIDVAQFVNEKARNPDPDAVKTAAEIKNSDGTSESA